MPEAYPSIETAKKYSEDHILGLRKALLKTIKNPSIGIVTVGSFARREASAQSDLDFFFITKDKKYKPTREIEKFKEQIHKRGMKMPAPAGAFNSEVEPCSKMVQNIGGLGDKTEKLTRRLLFLLEGEWLYNEALFDDLLEQLICTYVKDSITPHQLSRFLLNDLIRYYRTICVDFEYKTYEGGKSWGDRNIKLVFSRKLLYFSGILVVAETVQHTCEFKRDILRRYLRLTPVERLKRICGTRCEKVLSMYDDFLEEMSQDKVRLMLKNTTDDREKQTDEFRNFKNKGHHFTWELSRLLTETYDSTHPIHAAIKF